MRKYTMGTACLAVTAALTAYLALDTFVIQNVYQTDAMSSDASSAFAALEQTMQSGSASVDEDNGSDAEEGADQSAGDAEAADEGGEASSTVDDTSQQSTGEESSQDTQDTSFPGHGSRPGSGGMQGHGRHGAGSTSTNSQGNASQSGGSSSGSSTSAGSGSSSTIGDEVVSAEETSEQYEAYSDGNVTISVKEYTVNDTQVYVADVQVTSAEYLKTAFANNAYGRNVTAKTSETAADNDAVLAINGDYYGAQETGYVIRNGVVYRSTSSGAEDVLCIYADGTMKIVSTADYTAEELVAQGVWQAFSFGPALVEDGELVVDENDEAGRAMASNPRTAIGVIDANHYLFVVSDGRTDESAGLSLSALGEFMQSLGATCAYNLDGGGSSTMYYRGEVINNPTTTGKISEREVSDIVYIG